MSFLLLLLVDFGLLSIAAFGTLFSAIWRGPSDYLGHAVALCGLRDRIWSRDVVEKSFSSADLIAKSVHTNTDTAKGLQKGGIRSNVMRQTTAVAQALLQRIRAGD